MAEALLNHFGGDNYSAFSAGTQPGKVRTQVIQLLNEEGIDTSNLFSKGLNQFIGQKFNWVITTCDQAKQECPYFSGAQAQIHWSLPDPSESTGTEIEIMEKYKQVFVQLKALIQQFIVKNS
jgi:arsenate reductase